MLAVSFNLRSAFAMGLLACTMALSSQATFAAGSYTYSANGGEVTDTTTGLIWQRCSVGQIWAGNTCTGMAASYTHQGALSYAASQNGWRLPNVKELSSLVDSSGVSPPIDIAAFPNTPSYFFWTASPFVGDTSNAWVVYSIYGGPVGKAPRTISDGYLRLVR